MHATKLAIATLIALLPIGLADDSYAVRKGGGDKRPPKVKKRPRQVYKDSSQVSEKQSQQQSEKPAKKRLKNTTNEEKQNAYSTITDQPFYSFPPELQMQIAEYLSPTDRARLYLAAPEAVRQAKWADAWKPPGEELKFADLDALAIAWEAYQGTPTEERKSKFLELWGKVPHRQIIFALPKPSVRDFLKEYLDRLLIKTGKHNQLVPIKIDKRALIYAENPPSRTMKTTWLVAPDGSVTTPKEL
jgi:hypothetical protein